MEPSDHPSKENGNQRKRRASDPPSPEGGKRVMDPDVITLNDSTSDSSMDKQENDTNTSSDDDEVKVVRVIPSEVVPSRPPGINNNVLPATEAPPGIAGVPVARNNQGESKEEPEAPPPGSDRTSTVNTLSNAPSSAACCPTADPHQESSSSRSPSPVAPRATIASLEPVSRSPSRPTTSSTMMSPSSFSPRPLPTTLPNTESIGTSGAAPTATERKSEKCMICMDAAVNATLHTCCHMCMCYECARRLHASKGTCPICRAPVQDVTKA